MRLLRQRELTGERRREPEHEQRDHAEHQAVPHANRRDPSHRNAQQDRDGGQGLDVVPRASDQGGGGTAADEEEVAHDQQDRHGCQQQAATAGPKQSPDQPGEHEDGVMARNHRQILEEPEQLPFRAVQRVGHAVLLTPEGPEAEPVHRIPRLVGREQRIPGQEHVPRDHAGRPRQRTGGEHPGDQEGAPLPRAQEEDRDRNEQRGQQDPRERLRRRGGTEQAPPDHAPRTASRPPGPDHRHRGAREEARPEERVEVGGCEVQG